MTKVKPKSGGGRSIRLNTRSSEGLGSKTSNVSFSDKVRGGVQQGLTHVQTAAGIAAPFIPGGAVVSASIAQANASAQQAFANSGGNVGAFGGSGVSVGGGGGGGVSGAGVDFSGVGTTNLSPQVEAMLAQLPPAQQNAIRIQESLQAQQRLNQLISNILKIQHESAKNAIQNIR